MTALFLLSLALWLDDLVSSVAKTVKSADKPGVDEDAVLAKLEKDGKAVLEARRVIRPFRMNACADIF
jgi:hypothetical protein